MTRKRVVQLIVFALVALLAIALVGGIGCSCGEESENADDTTPADVPLMTASEAAGVVYQYLVDRLEEGSYRSRLTAWGGRSGATYAGNHKWNVTAGTVGTWSLQERTGTVTPANLLAQNITRSYFK